jgi:hypothetical protein
MIKEFTPYQEALELKELGFDEPCFGYYVDGELRGINLGMEELGGVEPYYQRFGFHTLSNHDIDNPNKIVVTVPTYSQAFRWFRKKHRLSGLIEIGRHEYSFVIFDEAQDSREITSSMNGAYEEAELACLRKLIEIVKNKGGDK